MLAERSAGLILSFAEWRPVGMDPHERAKILQQVDVLKTRLLEAAQELTGLAIAYLNASTNRAFAEDEFGDVVAHYIDSASMTAIKNWVDEQSQYSNIMGSGSLFAGGGVAKPIDTAPWESAQKQWGSQLIKGLLQQQAAAINESIASGIKDGLSREQVTHRLLRDVPSQLMPEWRARLISQTEVIRAYNSTSHSRILSQGGEYVEWLDGQKAACPSCQGLHHRIIPVKPDLPPVAQPYFYDPIRGFTVQYPPLHPGCRCTIVSATEEDYAGQPDFDGGQLVYPSFEGEPMPLPKPTKGATPILDSFITSGLSAEDFYDQTSFADIEKLGIELGGVQSHGAGSYSALLDALEAKKAQHDAGAIEAIVEAPPLTPKSHYPATMAGKFKEWWDSYPDHSIAGLKALQQFAKAEGVPFQQISKLIKAEGYEIGHLTGAPAGEFPDPTGKVKVKVPGVKEPKIQDSTKGLKTPNSSGALADRPQSYWDQLTKESGPKGSNPGGIYVGPDGTKYYLKQYSNPLQGPVEIAAQRFYEMLGLGVPQARMITINGVSYYASELIEGAKSMTAAEMKAYLKKHPEEAARLHVASIITQNWDVIGLSYDNLMLGPNGKLLVIDTGGSFIFRAQGGSKPFSITADEFDSLLNPSINKQTSDVFGKLYDKPEAVAAAKAAVDHYRKYLNEAAAFLPPGVAGPAGLKAKLDDLYMKLESVEKRAAISTMKFPDLVASHELDLVRQVGAKIIADTTLPAPDVGLQRNLAQSWSGSSNGTIQDYVKAQLASYMFGISAEEAWNAEMRRRNNPETGWEQARISAERSGWSQAQVLSIYRANQIAMHLPARVKLYRGMGAWGPDNFIAKIKADFDRGASSPHNANWLASYSDKYEVARDSFARPNSNEWAMVIKTEVPSELIFGDKAWIRKNGGTYSHEQEFITMGPLSGFEVNPANTEIWQNRVKKYNEQEDGFKPMNPDWKPTPGVEPGAAWTMPDDQLDWPHPLGPDA